METADKNKLIAEFLGYPLDEKENLHWIDSEESYGYKTSDLKYHSDWNWLMEAVSKINTMENFRFSARINHLYTFVRDHRTHTEIIDEGGNNTIDGCYNAVVEFIKFYNDETKKESNQ